MGWVAKALAKLVRWAVTHPETIAAGIDLIQQAAQPAKPAK